VDARPVCIDVIIGDKPGRRIGIHRWTTTVSLVVGDILGGLLVRLEFLVFGAFVSYNGGLTLIPISEYADLLAIGYCVIGHLRLVIGNVIKSLYVFAKTNNKYKPLY